MKTTVHYVRPLSVALLTALSITFSGSVFAVAGKFQFVNGEVQVIDTAGKPRLAQKGGAIDEGETVSSSGNGFAQIKMEDGGFFAVRPDTEFKVDTFQFNGKEDGSEKGVFSLIKGSLRSVTGLIGKKHKDNYKIQTATSTIGIRGSGADVGHSNAIGTAVRTLFGGHSLTSGGKTIVTGPGQTALAPPGQAPGYVANFPFNTATAPGGNGQENKNEGNGGKSGQQQSENKSEKQGSGKSEKPEPLVVTDQKVVIPIKDTEGNDYTKNTDAGGGAIGEGIVLPAGEYRHFISALNNSYGGIFVAEQGGHNDASLKGYLPSNYTFDANGTLGAINDSYLSIVFANGQDNKGHSSLSVVGGTLEDFYYTPDKSLIIGRSSNVSVNTVCSTCSGTDNFISVHSVVGLLSAPAFVQTLTGSTSYVLSGSTHPSDGSGNVGTLNSAHLDANFTNMTVNFDLNLTIAGKTLDAYANGVSIVHDGFDADSGGILNVSCAGASCVAGGYYGDVGGKFFGKAAGTAGFGYDFWPNSDNGSPPPTPYYTYTEYIHGLAAFVAGSTPTATPSAAGVVGGGGAAVGSFSAAPGNDFNDFNIVDNVHFASRHSVNGDLIAWTDNVVPSANQASFAARGTVVQDGTDTTMGVVWGRWSAFSATMDTGMGSTNLPNQGGLSFITGAHITTMAELANYASFTGTGLSMGNTTGTYSLLPAGSFPTGVNGLQSGTITSGTATVTFNTGNMAFSVGGTSPTFNGAAAWNVSGSGLISDFMSNTGITLTDMSSVNGKAVGGFVGNQAQGLISTVGLTDGSGNKLGGAVYMKR